MKIERDKKYRLRNGDIVRVICVDANTSPVIVQNLTTSTLGYRTETGAFSTDVSQHDIVAEVREPREFWINIDSGTILSATVMGMKTSPLHSRFIKVREVIEE